jgi:hypothetical protein
MVEITFPIDGKRPKYSTNNFNNTQLTKVEIMALIPYRKNCVFPVNSLSVKTTYFNITKP